MLETCQGALNKMILNKMISNFLQAIEKLHWFRKKNVILAGPGAVRETIK